MRNEPHRVDAYLAALAPEQRDALSRLRATVRAGAPDAHEGIAYGMPAFYSGTRFLVSYAAFKRHLLTSKTTKRKRGLRGGKVVKDQDAAKLARMLPYK